MNATNTTKFSLPSNRNPDPTMTVETVELGAGYGNQIEARVSLSVDGEKWDGTIWIEPDPINDGYSHCFDADDDYGALARWLKNRHDCLLFDPDLFAAILAAQ